MVPWRKRSQTPFSSRRIFSIKFLSPMLVPSLTVSHRNAEKFVGASAPFARCRFSAQCPGAGWRSLCTCSENTSHGPVHLLNTVVLWMSWDHLFHCSCTPRRWGSGTWIFCQRWRGLFILSCMRRNASEEAGSDGQDGVKGGGVPERPESRETGIAGR